MSTMEIAEIMRVLPHRHPFLLLDRVLSVESGKHLRAAKNVSINEPFFQGHFPRGPVMPGVLIIEALAQACAILTFKTRGFDLDDNSVYYFVGIDNARFKRPVGPGDVLILDVTLLRQIKGVWRFGTQALVENKIVAEAELMCTVGPLPKQ
ncbi:MAG: 3-hydroxyacyl-ACP dehydratase FabZ [Burkholderiales bacterium]